MKSVMWVVLVACLGACQRDVSPNEAPVIRGAGVDMAPREQPLATPKSAPDDLPERPEVNQTKPAEEPVLTEPEEEHVVFIGKPRTPNLVDCKELLAPSKPRADPGLHDATDYPDRHAVSIDIVSVLHGSIGDAFRGPPPSVILGAEPGEQLTEAATVNFATGRDAFRNEHFEVGYDDFDAAYCERLNTLLSSEFVVIHAYVVHTDRGNSAYDRFRETWGSLGTDPHKSNRGFSSFEDAQAFANKLLGRP